MVPPPALAPFGEKQTLDAATLLPAMDDCSLVVPAFDALTAQVAILDAAGRIVRVNERWRASARENDCKHGAAYLGESYLDVCHRAADTGDELAGEALAGVGAVLSGAAPRYAQNYPCTMPSGTHWFRMTVTPMAAGAVVVHDDVTPLVEAELRQKLLKEELNHRVKNTLAIVHAIAAQTVRSAADVQSVKTAFINRIAALAQVHDILTKSAWAGAMLHDVAGATLEPFKATNDGAIEVIGPPVDIGPGVAVTLSLTLQELATNAVKYGALRDPGGRVRLAWKTVSVPPGLEIEWAESGGPLVTPPTHEGFGTRLIRSLARTGDVSIAYLPQGVEFRLVLELPGA